MSIWHIKPDIARLNEVKRPNMGTHIGIEFTEIGDDYLVARMPVDEKTRQPYGILHGGASVVLAETVGSVASYLVVDHEKFLTVGQEVNANHLRAVKEGGYVTARCTPLHLGGGSHVWDIRLHDDQGRLTCVSRLTVAVLSRDRIK
jgi:1,4-dihydroxy-2-naphthoyl-CoA hydrolase